MIELYIFLGLVLALVLALAVVGMKGCVWFIDRLHSTPTRTVTRNTPPKICAPPKNPID